jgi:crotonobetainyl-CoA:carnitine CoA-transferase CaiB-like acyl-CoA transferase
MSEDVNLLHGLRVVEWGGGLSAAVAGWYLGELGAEVTRIEGPSCAALRQRGDRLDLALHHRKSRVPVSADDTVAVMASAAGADVLLEDQRGPNAAAREAAGRFPAIVAVSMTPHGRTGPRADHPASDLTASAVSALSWGLGERDREPLPVPYDIPSVQAGLWGVAGALAALIHRDASGRGQWVDVAAADVLASYAIGHAILYRSYGRPYERGGSIVGFGGEPLRCRDGAVSLVATSRQQWAKIVELVSPHVAAANDESFTDYLQAIGNRAQSLEILTDWTRRHTRDELTTMAIEAGIPLGPYLAVDEAIAHHALEEFVADVERDGVRTRAARVPLLVATCGEEQPPPPPRSFDGMRVVEIAANWTGPMVGAFLADHGAEVIRVESRRRLEPLRRMPPPLRRDGTAPDGDRADLNPYFHNVNRNKRSVTIDFSTDEGRRAALDLVAVSDVFIENLGPGVIERAGLGFDALRAVNPTVVMLSAPMFPPGNPFAEIRGYAPITSSVGGLESIVGYADEAPCGMTKVGIADPNAGVQGAVGVLAALWRRSRDGLSRHVTLSQVAAVLAALPEPVSIAAGGHSPGPVGAGHLHHAPHGHFASADDGWVAIAVTAPDEWEALCAVLDREDLAADVSLRDAAGRIASRVIVDGAVREWAAAMTADEAVASLLAAGVPAARLADFDAVIEDEHFAARGCVTTWDHHLYGPETMMGNPARLDATPPTIRRSAPDIGEANDEILGGLLRIGSDDRGRVGA